MDDDSSFRRSLGDKTTENETPPAAPPAPPAPEVAPAHDPLLGEDVEEAQFEEAPSVGGASQAPKASKEAVGELSKGGASPRRRFIIIAGGAILLLAIIVAIAGGGSKPTSTTTSPQAPTPTSTTPATPVAPKPAKPGKTTPAVPVTPATPIAPTKGGTSTGTRPPSKITLPGLPTAQDKANARSALDFAVKTVTGFSGVHCVGPHFKLQPGQTRTSYLIANPGELECNILTDTGYHIKVVSSSPKPFENGQQGELSATFAPQAGFILLYTTAGKLGIPYSHEIKIS